MIPWAQQRDLVSGALKTKGYTPKYGLVFHSVFIGRAAAKNKGRMSRYLATKCGIASRIGAHECIWGRASRTSGGRTVWRFLKKLQIELPYDPAIPLLGIYPEKTIIQKESCTTMFTAALFTIARTWKQPKCPSTDEWIKKM